MNRQREIDRAVRHEGTLLEWCRHIKNDFDIEPSMIDMHGWPDKIMRIQFIFVFNTLVYKWGIPNG